MYLAEILKSTESSSVILKLLSQLRSTTVLSRNSFLNSSIQGHILISEIGVSSRLFPPCLLAVRKKKAFFINSFILTYVCMQSFLYLVLYSSEKVQREFLFFVNYELMQFFGSDEAHIVQR